MNSVLIGEDGVYQLKDVSFTTGHNYNSFDKSYYFLHIVVNRQIVESHPFDVKYKGILLDKIATRLSLSLLDNADWYFLAWFESTVDDVQK